MYFVSMIQYIDLFKISGNAQNTIDFGSPYILAPAGKKKKINGNISAVPAVPVWGHKEFSCQRETDVLLLKG